MTLLCRNYRTILQKVRELMRQLDGFDPLMKGTHAYLKMVHAFHSIFEPEKSPSECFEQAA